jgi:hypothetical protein
MRLQCKIIIRNIIPYETVWYEIEIWYLKIYMLFIIESNLRFQQKLALILVILQVANKIRPRGILCCKIVKYNPSSVLNEIYRNVSTDRQDFTESIESLQTWVCIHNTSFSL